MVNLAVSAMAVDGHNAGLDGIGNDEVGCVRDAAGHVEANDEQALFAHVADGLPDFALHERSGEDEGLARGRRATARTASASAASPTRGMVSMEICSPRMLWRSASEMAPMATWPTCAPPPMMMMRLPYIFCMELTMRTSWTMGRARSSSSMPAEPAVI